jgi:hypothetical protein
MEAAQRVVDPAPQIFGAIHAAEEISRYARSVGLFEAMSIYRELEKKGGYHPLLVAELGKRDLFFFIVRLLRRHDLAREWLYARVREYEGAPDGYLDLWAREHYKSTIITYAGTMQDILSSHGSHPLAKWKGVEVTVGIFSHTRPIARKFLAQIKGEFERNEDLKALYPDVLWTNPQRDAQKWSEEGGIVVKRKTNPKECTVEAWGLVDGQPTSAHFFIRVYDDVVTRESVNTPEMSAKTTEMWELSQNLGVAESGIERTIGTRYAFMDTYHEMIQRGVCKVRLYPSTDDGTETGVPVLLSKEAHEKKRRAMGAVTFAAQMLQKPISRATATFEVEHLKFAEIRPKTLNIYIMCDPAHSKRRGSDRTAIPVVAVDAARNKYLVDGYNHRMNLTERWKALKNLRKKWMNTPGVQSVKVGYERYGMQSDMEHFEQEMIRDNESFEIVELAWPRDGPGAKSDRVARLRPDFEAAHFFLPLLAFHESSKKMCFMKVEKGEVVYQEAKQETKLMSAMARAGEKHRILRPIKQLDEEGRLYDLSIRFIVEYLAHPAAGAFDDLIDGTSRIYDMEVVPPIIVNDKDLEPELFIDS